MLSSKQLRATGAWIAAHQEASGALPWWRGGKMDPWDHVHAAMGLTIAGFRREATAAYRFLGRSQFANGAWPAERQNGAISDATQESNHAAHDRDAEPESVQKRAPRLGPRHGSIEQGEGNARNQDQPPIAAQDVGEADHRGGIPGQIQVL